jgi:hypothetical protein
VQYHGGMTTVFLKVYMYISFIEVEDAKNGRPFRCSVFFRAEDCAKVTRYFGSIRNACFFRPRDFEGGGGLVQFYGGTGN